VQTLINNNTCDPNGFKVIVANFEKSKSRERLGVTLRVRLFNLALAGGQSLALIRSQQIQRRGRAPIFIKCQLPCFLGGCRFSDRRQYPGSLSRMAVPSIIFIGWHQTAYLGHCSRRSWSGYEPLWRPKFIFIRRRKILYGFEVILRRLPHHDGGPSGHAVWGGGLRPLACWDCGLESHQGHRCLAVVSVVCCMIEVSATSWSHTQRSATECGASLSVI